MNMNYNCNTIMGRLRAVLWFREQTRAFDNPDVRYTGFWGQVKFVLWRTPLSVWNTKYMKRKA